MRTRTLTLAIAAGFLGLAVPAAAHAAPARTCSAYGDTTAAVRGFSHQDIDDSGYPDPPTTTARTGWARPTT